MWFSVTYCQTISIHSWYRIAAAIPSCAKSMSFFCHPFIFDLEQDLFCKGFFGVIFCKNLKKPRKTILWIVIIKSQEQKIGKIYKWNDKTAQPKSFQNRSKDFLYNIFLKKMLVYIDIYRQKKNIYIFLAPVCKKFCRPVFIIFLVNAFHNRHCSSNKRSAVVIHNQRTTETTKTTC